MSFLNWFFGRKTPVALLDKIWLTCEAARTGFLAELHSRLSSDRLVFVIAPFPDRLAELEQLLTGAALSYLPITGPVDPLDVTREFGFTGSEKILVGLGDFLVPFEHRVDSPDSSTHISVLVRERHPLRSHDDRIEDFAASLPCAADVQFFLSLEDALMYRGRWLTTTLRLMGNKETEAMGSDMLSNRIKAAQRKIERSCTEAIRPARSAADWMTNNMLQ